MGTILLVVAIAACESPARAMTSLRWGVVPSSCVPDRAAANRAAGVKLVVLEALWDHYQPTPSGVDDDYVRELNVRLSTCLGAGLRVILSPGVQYPPAWVRQLPGAAFRDQHGSAPASGAVNVVFSAPVRQAVHEYLRRLTVDLPLAQVEAVRLGTTDAGELGYPGPTDGPGDGAHDWWAFDDAAQTGVGLPADQAPTPLPGWVPGETTWRGRTVTTDDAAGWFQWYQRALVGAVVGQAEVLRAAGYGRDLHIPVAGRGVLPIDLQRATAARLDGSADPDGSLERGLYYPDQFALLADASVARKDEGSAFVLDLTSVDDATAVRARNLTPPQDTCRIEDPEASLHLTTPVHSWANLRWSRAIAARTGLSVIGENPGPPSAATGGTADSDSEAEQLVHAPRYAVECRLAAFLFAFEDDLHTGRSAVTLEDYARVISDEPPPTELR
ncbi:MAG: hypothetical protein ACR2GH_21540 [Pseudonocardia sp.]